MRFALSLLLSLGLLQLFAPSAAAAGETLDSVLARAAAQRRVVVDYREVRHMQLLTKPWQASGRMYIDADRFVMAQHQPYRQLLVTRKSMYWLYIPGKYFRRAGMVSDRLATADFGVFRAIMRGDRQGLTRRFDVRFSVDGREWRIALRPKRADGAHYRHIVVKGHIGQAADAVRIEMSDGDATDWFFTPRRYTAKTAARLKALVTEARGQ